MTKSCCLDYKNGFAVSTNVLPSLIQSFSAVIFTFRFCLLRCRAESSYRLSSFVCQISISPNLLFQAQHQDHQFGRRYGFILFISKQDMTKSFRNQEWIPWLHKREAVFAMFRGKMSLVRLCLLNACKQFARNLFRANIRSREWQDIWLHPIHK